MRKRLFSVLLTAALLGTMMTACGKKEEAEKKEPEAVETVTAEPEATVTETPEAAETPAQDANGAVEGLSEDLYSFQIQLNDIVYTIPASLSEFVETGWTIEEDGELEPNQMTLTTVAKNGEAEVYFQLVNTQANVLPFAECSVGQVSVDTYQAEGGTSIVLPKNITIGSSYEEVIEAYGEASDLYDSDTRKALTYSLGSYSEVSISVDAETNKVSKIEVENMIAQEKSEAISDDAAPQSVKDYQAPSKLGDDYTAFNIKYDGDLYTLPIPVTAFVENGWTFVSDENEMLAAKSSNVRFSMRKGNQVLDTIVHNYDSSEQPMKFCYVTQVEYYDLGAKLPLELPKGITENSSYDDIVKAYGEPANTEDSSSFVYYEYGEYRESITFMFDKEKNIISKIEVEYSPKELN